MLPIDDSNLLEFYKIMSIKGAVTKSHIIFVTELPLVSQQEFTLYKLIPIPTRINNRTLVIMPDAEFLASSTHRDEYVVLNSNQFDKCTTVMDDLFLCRDLQVKIDRNSDNYSCELALFNNKTSQNCNLHQVHNGLLINPMHQLNHWVYATTESTELTAVCGLSSI